jgi:anti-sigma regulatory factor (Ser/Thr protein kinase)
METHGGVLQLSPAMSADLRGRLEPSATSPGCSSFGTYTRLNVTGGGMCIETAAYQWTEVLSATQKVTATLVGDARAPGRARDVLCAIERDVEVPLLEDLRLLISELVTNSLRHSRMTATDTVALNLMLSGETVRVQVSDIGPWRAPALDPEGVSGWGLRMVDQLADRWGIERNGGTRVWFEIDRPLTV